jgi:hypothetical protein
MSFTKDSKQKLTAIAAVVIVALLGLNAFLVYNKISQDRKIESQNLELEEAEQLKVELEKEYYDALAQLEGMRGQAENLNALIDQQKEELTTQKEKIDRMIRQGRSSKNQLASAKQQISELKAQLDNYLVEINTLKEENMMLADANMQLSEDKRMLTDEVNTERTMNSELTTAKAALVSENQSLETQRSALSKKVNLASVITVTEVSATGWKNKQSGKPKKKSYAKNVEYLKICFDATANEIADPGMEQFYIRIINPIGETLAVEDLGSGITTNTKTGEEIRFTQVKELDYNNEEMTACFYWQPNTPFAKGTYDVEIYNKGYLAGTGAVTLK